MNNFTIYGASLFSTLFILWIMWKTCSNASENAIKEAMEGNCEPMKDLQDNEGGLK